MMLPLYVTSGEPAGIGPDICLSLAERVDERPIIVLADLNMLKARADQLKLSVALIEYTGQDASSKKGQLYVEHVPLNRPVALGELNPNNAAYVDRKSTRLNSSHVKISYAVFCLKKKNPNKQHSV